MRLKIKNFRRTIIKMFFCVVFILCLSIIGMGETIVNVEVFSVKAESSNNDLVINNWGYFCYLEESYRNQHPNATYEEVCYENE